CFFFQAEDGIRDFHVTGVQTCALPILFLMVWFTIFNTLSAFANSYNTLMIVRFLSGLPHGAFFGIGAVVAGRLAKPGKSAQAIRSEERRVGKECRARWSRERDRRTDGG